jgi:hypothetical protein
MDWRAKNLEWLIYLRIWIIILSFLISCCVYCQCIHICWFFKCVWLVKAEWIRVKSTIGIWFCLQILILNFWIRRWCERHIICVFTYNSTITIISILQIIVVKWNLLRKSFVHIILVITSFKESFEFIFLFNLNFP